MFETVLAAIETDMGVLIALLLLVGLVVMVLINRRHLHRVTATMEQRTQALADSANRQAAILNTVVDGIITIDQLGIIATINPAAERIFGYDAAEVVGQNVKILMPEPFHSEHDTYLHNYRTTGQAKIIGIGREVEGRRKDGTTFPLELSVGQMKVAGRPMFTGIVRDVTERHTAQRALQQSADQLAARSKELIDSANRQSAILNTVVDGIITINQYGTVETFNPAAEQIFGYPAAEVVGQNVKMLMPQPFQREHDGYLHNYRESGHAKIIGIGREVEGLRSDGTTFPMELSVGKMEIEGVPMFTGIVRDVTERHAARRSLLESSQRMEVAARAAGFGVWDYDIIQNELIWDERMYQLYGIQAAQFSGVYDAWSRCLHPDDMVRAEAELQRAIDGEGEFETEFTVVWPNGEEHIIEAIAVVLRDEGGTPLRMIGVNIDITDRRRMDRMKNEFVSTVSHELRTPLTSIKGSLGLIRSGATGELPPKLKVMLDIAYNNSDRLVRLINDILDIEKIEAGKMDFRMQSMDLSLLIDEALTANRGYAEQHGVLFRLESQGEAITVEGDHDRLMQAITNLLSNAAKFSPSGGEVTVGLYRKRQAVRVEISDHGSGIPAAFRDKIFGKFSQADGSDTRQKGGTGLGLSITKAIIEHHGGQIGFNSEEGVGTTFWFEVPVSVEGEADLESSEMLREQSCGRILVCEDEVDIARVLRQMLMRAGFTVDVAPTIEAALVQLGGNDYDAMTLDLRLPDGNGMELLSQLRTLPRNSEIAVVVVSALADAVADEFAANGGSGVSDWQQKPIDDQRLIAALRGALMGEISEQARILHVEDDADIRQVVSALVGETAEVTPAPTLSAARTLLHQAHFDLIILDLTLPDGSGESLIPQLAASMNPHTPIVVFSARELGEHQSSLVSAALLKSKTSNDKLLTTIRVALSPRGLLLDLPIQPTATIKTRQE